jgi:glucose-1-phosphate thymidylyltransferase
MKALLTAGGHGTRLQPLTHTQNKHLIPIANKPMIHFALEYLKEAGIIEVGIIINAGDTSFPEVLGDGSNWGIKITYIEQEAPLGLAHVVKIAEPFIGEEPFVFYLGDNILVGGIKKFIDTFKTQKSNCHLVLSQVGDPTRFGVAEIKDDKILNIEEKPLNPKSNYAVTGIYFYDKSIFEAVNAIKPSARGELEISDAHQYLLDHNKKITFSEITGWWKDTGNPADLLEANRLVTDNIVHKIYAQVDESNQIFGRVIIEQGAKLKNCVIRGPAIIGKNSVLVDAYIGPFTSISDGCFIGNSEVEYSIVMEGSRIQDAGIRIEGSLIGKNVDIVKAKSKPRTQRFMIGDQSRVELL